MIKNIATQAIYVEDQLRAEEFWVKKVGFTVTTKQVMGKDFWLEVSPQGAESRIVLYPRALMKDWNERRSSIVFECDDVHETYQQLKSDGVQMGMPITKMTWGTYASFMDLDGNEFIIKSCD